MLILVSSAAYAKSLATKSYGLKSQKAQPAHSNHWIFLWEKKLDLALRIHYYFTSNVKFDNKSTLREISILNIVLLPFNLLGQIHRYIDDKLTSAKVWWFAPSKKVPTKNSIETAKRNFIAYLQIYRYYYAFFTSYQSIKI